MFKGLSGAHAKIEKKSRFLRAPPKLIILLVSYISRLLVNDFSPPRVRQPILGCGGNVSLPHFAPHPKLVLNLLNESSCRLY